MLWILSIVHGNVRLLRVLRWILLWMLLLVLCIDLWGRLLIMLRLLSVENALLLHLADHVRGYCSRPALDVGIVTSGGIDASPDKEDKME